MSAANGLKNIWAESAEWKTATGTTETADAKGYIHIGSYETEEFGNIKRPLAVISPPRDEMIVITGGNFPGGMLRFHVEVVGGDPYSDEESIEDFYDTMHTLRKEIMELSLDGTVDRLFVTAMTFSDIQRVSVEREGSQEIYLVCEGTVSYGINVRG